MADMTKPLVMKSLVRSNSRTVMPAFSGGNLLANCGANFASAWPAGMSSNAWAAAELGEGCGAPAVSGCFFGNAYWAMDQAPSHLVAGA